MPTQSQGLMVTFIGFVIFQYLGDHYHDFHNKEKFKKIEGSDGIFEIKSHQIRIFCFFAPEHRLMLEFGVTKKSDKHKKKDIKKAEKIKNWFFSTQLKEK